jgi:hypothetical protein
MRTLSLFLPLFVACAPPFTGYTKSAGNGYCKANFSRVDVDDAGPAGYSANEAMAAVGRRFEGKLAWKTSKNAEYEVPLPVSSAFELNVDVKQARWGEDYTADTGGTMMMVFCPEQGLEVEVEGVLDLPGLDLSLPITGWILATATAGDGLPALDALAVDLSHDFKPGDTTFLEPTLDAIADREPYDWIRDEVRLDISLGNGPRTSLYVPWKHDLGGRRVGQDGFHPALLFGEQAESE